MKIDIGAIEESFKIYAEDFFSENQYEKFFNHLQFGTLPSEAFRKVSKASFLTVFKKLYS